MTFESFLHVLQGNVRKQTNTLKRKRIVLVVACQEENGGSVVDKQGFDFKACANGLASCISNVGLETRF